MSSTAWPARWEISAERYRLRANEVVGRSALVAEGHNDFVPSLGLRIGCAGDARAGFGRTREGEVRCGGGRMVKSPMGKASQAPAVGGALLLVGLAREHMLR
jgi:hypothetical protein